MKSKLEDNRWHHGFLVMIMTRKEAALRRAREVVKELLEVRGGGTARAAALRTWCTCVCESVSVRACVCVPAGVGAPVSCR